jgi:hypothetical protein
VKTDFKDEDRLGRSFISLRSSEQRLHRSWRMRTEEKSGATAAEGVGRERREGEGEGRGGCGIMGGARG